MRRALDLEKLYFSVLPYTEKVCIPFFSKASICLKKILKTTAIYIYAVSKHTKRIEIRTYETKRLQTTRSIISFLLT